MKIVNGVSNASGVTIRLTKIMKKGKDFNELQKNNFGYCGFDSGFDCLRLRGMGIIMNFKDEFERLHREINLIKMAINIESERDRKQISAKDYEVARHYGEISRRLQTLETKVQQILTNIGLEK